MARYEGIGSYSVIIIDRLFAFAAFPVILGDMITDLLDLFVR